MGITITSTKTTANGDDSTTVFNFLFKAYQDSEVRVVLRSALGVETVQTITTHYTVSRNNGEGGSITMVTPPASGEVLLIKQNIALTQPDSISVGALPSSTLETIADRLTLLSQQVKEIAERAPLLRETTTSGTPELPEPEDGKILAWNAAGDLVNATLSTTDATVLDEDTMASDSSTAVPSQQSTKAYVDNSISALNLLATTISTTATLTASQRNILLTGDPAYTVTLAPAADWAGQFVHMIRTNAYATKPGTAITIDGNGSETINGLASIKLYTGDESIVLYSDGSNVRIFSWNQNSLWTSYTPTMTGFGTVSSVDFHWQRVGGCMHILGKFTCGTNTATEAQITLPTTATVDLTICPTVKVVGKAATGYTTAYVAIVLATGGDAFLNIGRDEASTSSFTPVDGNSIGNSVDIGISAMVPITGWNQ